MILDQRLLLSDQQVITATANSTNVIDQLPLGKTYDGVQLIRRSNFMKIPLLIQVTEAFNNLTSLAIVLQTDDDEAFGTASEVIRMTIPLASLIAGLIAPIDMVPRGPLKRYLRMRYEVTGTAPSTGKITSGIVAAVDGRNIG